MAEYTMYVQNPESVDNDQGIYLKAEGEPEPWQTEADCEEFDYILNIDREGYYIRDLASARKWCDSTLRDADIVKVIFI